MKLMTVVVLAGCALLAPTTHLTAQAKPAAVEVLDAHVARAPTSKSKSDGEAKVVKAAKASTTKTAKAAPRTSAPPPTLHITPKAAKRSPRR